MTAEPFTVTTATGTTTGVILYAHDGQRVFRAGCFTDDDAVFTRRMKVSHLLYNPPAVALQQTVVEELAQRGCRTIEVTVSDDGSRYTVDFATFLRQGSVIDRNFGPQVMLPLPCWAHTGAVQPSLFEGVTDAN